MNGGGRGSTTAVRPGAGNARDDDRRDPAHESLYVAARAALLDALDALHPHLESVVVVGAQAVYLRAGSEPRGVSPFTTDADLALDPTSLRPESPIPELLGEAKISRDRRPHRGQPGMWAVEEKVAGEPEPVPIDLLVPEHYASTAGRRAARLGFHGKQTARKTPGLEGCLVDKDVLTVAALDPQDSRSQSPHVAGPAALLVAKAHKIIDRRKQAPPDRLSEKDAADVFRLLLTTRSDDLVSRYRSLLEAHKAERAARRGLRHLHELFGAPRRPGVVMASASLAPFVPAEQIATVCTGAVARLIADLGDEP